MHQPETTDQELQIALAAHADRIIEALTSHPVTGPMLRAERRATPKFNPEAETAQRWER